MREVLRCFPLLALALLVGCSGVRVIERLDIDMDSSPSGAEVHVDVKNAGYDDEGSSFVVTTPYHEYDVPVRFVTAEGETIDQYWHITVTADGRVPVQEVYEARKLPERLYWRLWNTPKLSLMIDKGIDSDLRPAEIRDVRFVSNPETARVNLSVSAVGADKDVGSLSLMTPYSERDVPVRLINAGGDTADMVWDIRVSARGYASEHEIRLGSELPEELDWYLTPLPDIFERQELPPVPEPEHAKPASQRLVEVVSGTGLDPGQRVLLLSVFDADPLAREDAAYVLAHQDEQLVGALVDMLDQLETERDRACAALALGEIGRRAEEAVPLLVEQFPEITEQLVWVDSWQSGRPLGGGIVDYRVERERLSGVDYVACTACGPERFPPGLSDLPDSLLYEAVCRCPYMDDAGLSLWLCNLNSRYAGCVALDDIEGTKSVYRYGGGKEGHIQATAAYTIHAGAYALVKITGETLAPDRATWLEWWRSREMSEADEVKRQ